ncbi:hypothetical protein ACJJIQ_10595 [Microbulbifer sp. ANSA003]|uniref:hypothetical protein n=1 Tax=Microbulbifer sp. ANSA003 TaxID=3243360 RepID=UPI0040414392
MNGLPDDWKDSRYELSETSSGLVSVKEIRKDGGGGEMSIFPVSTRIFSKVIVEIAELDEKLFELSEKAYEGVAEIDHVRESLVGYMRTKGDPDRDAHIESFCDYAVDQLADSFISLHELCKFCTGEDLNSHRLRPYTIQVAASDHLHSARLVLYATLAQGSSIPAAAEQGLIGKGKQGNEKNQAQRKRIFLASNNRCGFQSSFLC